MHKKTEIICPESKQQWCHMSLKHVQCMMSLTINYGSAVTTSGRGKIYHYLITIVHHNGTISGRSKMFYTIWKSLNKSICTTYGNMKHHFTYGLGWDHKKYLVNAGALNLDFSVLLNILHLLYFQVYFVYGISACSTF
jgi:hypothetical protein